MLKLNDDKTEVVYIASPYFQKSMPSESLQIGDTAVSQARKARNIGVIFDETTSMKDQCVKHLIFILGISVQLENILLKMSVPL